MASDTITLTEAARRLDVHYMTAYRYVRTGRLPATKVGGEWRVAPDDLRAITAPASATSAADHPAAGSGRRVDHAGRLERRLLAGDENGAWAIIETALANGTDPRDIHLDLLGPALSRIGEGWAGGRVSVAEEHRASVVTQRIIGRMGPRFTRPGRRRGTVVIGAPQGDHHSLPSAMAADLLRSEGLEVIDLGANTPPETFVEVATTTDGLVAVGICATSSGNDESIVATVELLHAATTRPVILGGGAIDLDSPDLGADVVTHDAEQMLRAVERALAD